MNPYDDTNPPAPAFPTYAEALAFDFFNFETICTVFYGEGALTVEDEDWDYHYDPDLHGKAEKEDRITA